jgi:hypothetical protein
MTAVAASTGRRNSFPHRKTFWIFPAGVMLALLTLEGALLLSNPVVRGRYASIDESSLRRRILLQQIERPLS